MDGRNQAILLTFRWLAIYWLAALATHAAGLYQPMHCDYSCRLRIAREWAAGKQLYRETYDNTQPVVYLWLLATDSPRPAVSAYLAETAMAAVASILLRAALLSALPPLAGAIPLLLIAFSGASPTFYGGQIAEAPAMWLDVIGLSCFWLAVVSGRPWLALAAGASYVLMVSFRVPAAANLLAWLPLLFASQISRAKTGLVVAAAAGGASLMLGLLYTHGQYYGYWDEFLVVLRRNMSYGSLDRVPLAASLIEGGKTLARILLGNTLVGLLLGVSAVMLVTFRGSLRQRERLWLIVAAVWLLAALASAFPGGRHYAHYYHLIWPALSLLSMLWLALPLPVGEAGTTLAWSPPQADRVRVYSFRDRLTYAIVAGALCMGLLSQAYAGARALRDLRQGTHAWNRLDAAAGYLHQHTTPGVPVLVHVWLDWAELYLRAPRPAPSLSIPHVVPRDRYREWLEATQRDLPEWIVHDGTPWEPIDGPLTDPATITLRNQLAARIASEYHEVQQFGELRILRRKGTP